MVCFSYQLLFSVAELRKRGIWSSFLEVMSRARELDAALVSWFQESAGFAWFKCIRVVLWWWI